MFYRWENRATENSFVRRKGRCIFLLLVFLVVSNARAQDGADTTRAAMPEEKSPTVAVLRSAFVPGWGQWYNGQKLKAALVLGVELGLVGEIVYYHRLVVKSSSDWEREFYEDWRSRFLWWLLAAHIVNMLDAYVDAHLWDFDTGPDLSIDGGLRGGAGAMITFRWGF